MDPFILRYVLRRSSVIPIVVSAWYLIRLWREAELFGTQLVVFVAWFVVALAIQVFARTPLMWLVGLLTQVGLAIVLVLKQQIDDIY